MLLQFFFQFLFYMDNVEGVRSLGFENNIDIAFVSGLVSGNRAKNTP